MPNFNSHKKSGREKVKHDAKKTEVGELYGAHTSTSLQKKNIKGSCPTEGAKIPRAWGEWTGRMPCSGETTEGTPEKKLIKSNRGKEKGHANAQNRKKKNVTENKTITGGTKKNLECTPWEKGDMGGLKLLQRKKN